MSLVAAVVLLVAFGVHRGAQQARAGADRGCCAAGTGPAPYLISLCIGTALFGMFFFLTLFVQEVWGYTPLRTGIAYLPMVATIMVAAGARLAAGRPDRRPAADDRRGVLAHRRDVLAVPDHRAQHVRRRPARADDADRARDGAAVRAAVAGRADQGGRTTTPAWPPACSTSASRSAARSGWRPRHGGVERGRRTACSRSRRRGRRGQDTAVHLSAGQAAAAAKAASNHALAHGFCQGYVVSAGIIAARADHRGGR